MWCCCLSRTLRAQIPSWRMTPRSCYCQMLAWAALWGTYASCCWAVCRPQVPSHVDAVCTLLLQLLLPRSQVCTLVCCLVIPISLLPLLFLLLLSGLLRWVVGWMLMLVEGCWGKMGPVSPCRLLICISTPQMWNSCHRMLGAWVWVGLLKPMRLTDPPVLLLVMLPFLFCEVMLKLPQCFGSRASSGCPPVVVQLLIPLLFLPPCCSRAFSKSFSPVSYCVFL